MGLLSENKCFFCEAFNPTWRHMIVCNTFSSMWELVKLIVVRSGIKWQQSILFNEVLDQNFCSLNHVVNLGYSVIFDSIISSVNGVQLKTDPVNRLRQQLFQLLYSNFKENCFDEVSCCRFELYWSKIQFLFKIT